MAFKLDRPVPEVTEVVTAFRDGFVGPRSLRRDEGFTFSDLEQGYQGVHAGDLVFHGLDGFSGAFGVAVASGRCTPVYHVMACPGDDARFVAYAMRVAAFGGLLEVQVPSTRQRAVDFRNWSTLAPILLPRPPVAIQRRIADFLDDQTTRIDRIIAARRQQVAELRWLVAAQRHQVWIDLEHEHGLAPLRRAVRCLDGARIPLNSEQRAGMAGVYAYWGAGSIVDHIDQYIFDEPLVLLGEDGAPFFDPLRDVSFVVRDRVWVNNHIHVLRPLKGTHPDFLSHMLNAVDYGAYISGSTRDKLTQDRMMGIDLPLPGRATQLDAARRLDSAAQESAGHQASLERSSDLLQEFKRSLISAAVSGEFDVRVASGRGVPV